MENSNDRLIEETAPGAKNIDRSWMMTFWEAFSDCVIEMDSKFIVTNVLRKTASTLTMDIVGKSFLDIAVDRERAFAASEIELLKTTDVPYRRFTFLSQLGRYYRWTLIALHEKGKFKGICGIAVDVTQQSLNEITLYWQRAIIEGSADFISIADMGGNVLYTNPGAYKMTGYDPSQGTLPLERIFSTGHLEIIKREGIKWALENGAWCGMSELLCRDGTLLPIEHNMFSVRNNEDETILVVTIIRDVTDYVEHERKMEHARRAAEAANIAKSEFLSRMSHEIRTPMNAIIGMINIGKGTDDVEKKDYCFRRAENASKHLLGIINDILDMSKIEADKFELSYGLFNFEKTLKNITGIANVRAEEKKQNFIVNIGADVPSCIFSDELRLSQVITNLLTNAIKFTPEEGTVILNIGKISEEGDGVNLRIEVSDTGIGISQEQQAKLFTSFNQANPGISQKFGGTGLGLAISRRIVELLGGKIWIESELGKGAKFIFEIRVKRAEGRTACAETGNGQDNEESMGTGPHYNFRNHNLLIAEDVDINREVMSAIFEETGVSIDYAENGKIAVSMFSENPEKYDIILMDINMPEMDGYEATKKIRSLDLPRAKDITIVAMTANVFREDVERCLASGMNDHTGKPVDADALFEIIKKYLRN